MRRWSLRMLSAILALALFVTTIGLFHFLFSSTLPPGSCVGLMSPVETVRYWYASGRKEALCDVLTHGQWARIAWNSAAVGALAGMLILTIRAQGPLRPSLRLRTLMILIAVGALAYVGGRELWTIWGRWESYLDRASYYEFMERASDRDLSGELASLSEDDRREFLEALGKRRESDGRLKQVYQRAVWRPWIDVDPSE